MTAAYRVGIAAGGGLEITTRDGLVVGKAPTVRDVPAVIAAHEATLPPLEVADLEDGGGLDSDEGADPPVSDGQRAAVVAMLDGLSRGVA